MSLNDETKRGIRSDANSQGGVERIVDFYKQNPSLQRSLLKYFEKISSNTQLMHHLAALGEIDLITLLLDGDADLVILDELGNTPMHFAVKNGRTKVVELYLDYDDIAYAAKSGDLALSAYRNKEGLTPLEIAKRYYPNSDMMQLLRNYTKKFKRKEEHYRALKLASHYQPLIQSFNSFYIGTKFGPDPRWKDASCVPEFNWLSNPTGQLQWKDLSGCTTLDQDVSLKRWGSGCLISDNLFLTAGHCFDSLPGGNDWKLLDRYTQEPLKSIEFASLMTVNFNYQLDACPISKGSTSIAAPIHEEKFNILKLSEYRLGGLDYAIIQLEGSPGKKYGKVQLSTVLPKGGEEVVVAQHPNGDHKKIDRGPILCKADSVDCDDKKRMYYNLDTERGSSGSPVALVEAKTVIGVHTEGFSKNGFQGNSAVTIKAIKAVSNILKESQLGFFSTQPAAAVNTNKQTVERKEHLSRRNH